MNPLSHNPLSFQQHYSSKSYSSTNVPYNDLDQAFANLLYKSKQPQKQFLELVSNIQSNMKYTKKPLQLIITEGNKFLGKKREFECIDKSKNEPVSAKDINIKGYHNYIYDINLIEEIKDLLLKTEHKYKEEHSKNEVLFFFNFSQFSYCITMNRLNKTITKFRKGNCFIGQDNNISLTDSTFSCELQKIKKELERKVDSLKFN